MLRGLCTSFFVIEHPTFSRTMVRKCFARAVYGRQGAFPTVPSATLGAHWRRRIIVDFILNSRSTRPLRRQIVYTKFNYK
ncbi:hypothetical protein LINPERPRIM_LOCUS25533 [Linum perenne]